MKYPWSRLALRQFCWNGLRVSLLRANKEWGRQAVHFWPIDPHYSVYILCAQVNCRAKFVWNQLVGMSFLDSFLLCCVKAIHHWFEQMPQLWWWSVGKKQLGCTFPWIVPRLGTHMKHLHTCLVEISSICLHSANNNSSAVFENLAVMREFL